jgi:nucleoside-diphosphate-sugar epimerase
MKLLITGACGHIGSYLIQNIHKIKKINEVLLIDNFNSQRFNSLFNIKQKKNLNSIILI